VFGNTRYQVKLGRKRKTVIQTGDAGFQNTDTLQELLLTISKYVSERRQGNASALHAFLYNDETAISPKP
jgi:hypothetical protein